VGHGLFHVLLEQIPTSSDVQVIKPAVWDAFCKRWHARQGLRLLWYAPENEVEEVPAGAARLLYVSEYHDLTPRTWRYALDTDAYGDNTAAFVNDASTSPDTEEKKVVGPYVRQYLVLHEIDPTVVTHNKGGVLYLLNATDECTAGKLALTVSQIPQTMCIVVSRSAIATALWCVLQRRFPRAERYLRIDAEPHPEYYMFPHNDESVIMWHALLIGATHKAGLVMLIQNIEKWCARKSGVFFHTSKLRIDVEHMQPEDAALVVAVARLVAWLMMRAPENSRSITFVNANTTDTRVALQNVSRPDAAVLPSVSLQALYKSLTQQYSALTAPITVLYM
jgi:hypothetical protein